MTVAKASVRKGSRRYKMTISLNVLNHLGINLYSNVPAVLSEVVANAWDADAHEVTIDIDKREDQIVIKDDGIGMTEEDVNHRYLNVGYRKRSELPGTTPEGRAAQRGAARALASTAGKKPTAQCGDSRFSVGQDERGRR
jgi:nitrate/nitrite-specific signal transduction histidine kinase